MLSRTWRIWRQALNQRGVWTAVVWGLAWQAVNLVGQVIDGINPFQPFHGFHSLFHPAAASPVAPTSLGAAHLTGAGAVVSLILNLGVMPFWLAGTYGLFAAAVRGESVTWRRFWTVCRTLYGRVWGVMGYTILYVLVTVILLPALIVLSPWWIRMSGGLFVDQLTWGESFRKSFRGLRFWGVLGTTVLGGITIIMVAGGLFVGLMVTGVLGPVGPMIYYVASAVLSVPIGLWGFSVYAAERDLGSEAERA